MALRRYATVLLLVLLACLVLVPTSRAEGPSPLLQLTTDPGSDCAPALVLASDGGLHLVWQSDRSGNDDLWYKASSDYGDTWSVDTQLTSDLYDDRAPAIMQAADGRLWVVWQSDRSGNDDIWYKTSGDGGTTWSVEAQLTSDPYDDAAPAIMQAGDGRLWVVWQSNRLSCGDIWYKTSDNNGVTWTADALLTNDGLKNRTPAIAQAGDGSIWVLWVSTGISPSRTRYTKSTDNGDSWEVPQELPTPEVPNYHPTAIEGPDSTLWVGLTANTDRWIARRNTDGTWVPEPFTPFTGTDQHPALAFRPDGTLIAAWESDRALNYDIWLGIPGEREDTDPPPSMGTPDRVPHANPDPTQSVAVEAYLSATTGIQDAALVWTRDGASQPDLALTAGSVDGDGNGQYTASLGPFPAGTEVDYHLRVQDGTGNVLEGFPSLTPREPEVPHFVVQPPFVSGAPLLLVMDGYAADAAPLTHYYTDALDARGDTYDVWNTYVRGVPGDAVLESYDAVIWAMPDDGSLVHYPEEAHTIGALITYLDGGGRLFISGQRIAEIEASGICTGYYTAVGFHRSYLHAVAVAGSHAYSLQGVTEDPIGDGLDLAIDGGADNQMRQMEINPYSGGLTVFSYLGSAVSSGSAAVRADTGTYRTVYFSFGFEAISTAADRAFVMDRVLDWLELPDVPSVTYVNPDGVCGGSTPCYETIQEGIDAVAVGGTVQVAAGTYHENAWLHKRLTLQGAGADATGTVIVPATADRAAIAIGAGGPSASEQLLVRDLRVTGATGEGSAGIWLTEAASHVKLQNVTAIGNAGPGIAFGSGAVNDVQVTDCVLSSNISGLNVGSATALYGLTVLRGRMEDNTCYGLNVAGQAGTTNLVVSGTTFARNGAGGVSGQSSANVLLWGYNGRATFSNVDIDATDALYGLYISGEWQEPSAPMGQVLLSSVHVTGSPVQAGFALGHYSDASQLSIDGLTIDVDLVAGVDEWGNRRAALFMADLSSTTPIVLANTQLTGAREPVADPALSAYDLCASMADIDARDVVFESADNLAIEDRVYHELDEEWLGLVTWVDNNVYVTQASGSIQRGVNAVAPGGTVNVGPGTYAEPLMTIKKPVTVRSTAGRSQTSIANPSGNVNVMVVASSDVTIDGFAISGSTGIAGQEAIALLARSELAGGTLSSITVRNCEFAAYDMQAMALYRASDCMIEGNVIHDLATADARSGMFPPGTTAPGGVKFYGGGSGNVVRNNDIYDIRQAAVELDSYDPASDSDRTMAGNGVAGNRIYSIGMPDGGGYGILVAGTAGVAISGNSFDDIAGAAVHNGTSTLLGAAGNWWGSEHGPLHASNPGGTGCEVSDDVAFSPWLGDGTDTQPDVVGFQPNPEPKYAIPTQLVFSTQPGGAQATEPLSPQPVLRAEDGAGYLGINFQGQVTAAIGANPGSGTLLGTNPVSASDGVAAFTDLAINKAGVGYTLTASAAGLSPATSDAFEVEEPHQEIPLQPGWNLVSIRLEPTDPDPAAVFDSISDSCDMVYAYNTAGDTAQWQQYSPALGADSTLTEINVAMGLWVHATGPVTLTVSGTTPTSPSIPLEAGWNLVGYPSDTARPVADALAPIAGQYDLVYGYDTAVAAGPWRKHNVTAPAALNDLAQMTPGRGYWVHVTTTEGCTWAVP